MNLVFRVRIATSHTYFLKSCLFKKIWTTVRTDFHRKAAKKQRDAKIEPDSKGHFNSNF